MSAQLIHQLESFCDGGSEVRQATESQQFVNAFVKDLDIDEQIAAVLVSEGFTTLEEVAYVPIEEMLSIEDFDEFMI